jgi:hydroxymethylpyrimidine/phosphomethylpyrimidine kinase
MQIVLTIAGSDSGGGAGIQADLKTFHQFGVFGTSAIVALTAQNTRGVTQVHPVPLATVRAQLDALAADLPPAAVKSGMLATAALVDEVADGISRHGFPNYVCDPVMVATSGDRLLDADAVRTVRERLLRRGAGNRTWTRTLLVEDPVERSPVGRARVVLLVPRRWSGGCRHDGYLDANEIVDVLVTPTDVRHFRHPRLATTSTHGTGCTLSAAVTAGLALRRPLERAVQDALDFVHRAMATAPGLGSGHGPLNHFAAAPAATA